MCFFRHTHHQHIHRTKSVTIRATKDYSHETDPYVHETDPVSRKTGLLEGKLSTHLMKHNESSVTATRIYGFTTPTFSREKLP